MAAILSFLPTLFGILGDLPKVLQAVQFLLKAVADAEATGKSGPDKLTAVLNDFEAFLAQVAPTWAGTFATIATDVESVVNEIVAFMNSFAKAAPAKP